MIACNLRNGKELSSNVTVAYASRSIRESRISVHEFILHLIIAIAAVTVFVLYAPFSRVTKVLFIFSYYMAYEYSIIGRSHSLSILLLLMPVWHYLCYIF